MKKNSLLLFIISITLFACNNIPKHAKYIPKDAQIVGAIDMSKLEKKLIWNALTGSEIFKEMQKNISSEESKSAMKDISNIGLKQHSSIYFYANGEKAQKAKTCIVIGMDDISKFESFLKKNYPSMSIEKGEGYSSTIIESNMVAAWNQEAALFFPLLQTITLDSADMNVTNSAANEIKSSLKTLFAMSDKESIVSNSHFKTLQKDGHDLSIWMNYEELYLKNAEASSNPFIKQEYFKESGVAAGIDFEKGKAVADLDYYMSKELAAIYKKNQPKNIDLDLIKRIPSKDIDLLVAYNLNPTLIQDYLKKFGLDGMLNMGLGFAGTSMDDITNTFNGDMMVALTDMKTKAITDSTERGETSLSAAPDMNIMVSMKLKDSKQFEKLINIGIKKNMITKNGNTYYVGEGDSKSGIQFDKTNMVFATDATMASTYLTSNGNGKESIPASVWGHFESNPMVMYADLKKMMNSVSFNPTSKEEEEFINNLKSFFTYVEMYGGKIKNNAIHNEGAVFLANENENSFIQLLNLGMKAKKLKEIKDASNTPTIDSMSVQ